jgi:glycosyltransferase involved in cell wall biosynthesis
MNCCHLTSVHPALDTRIFYKECLSLSKAGFDVTLIAPHGRNEEIDRVKIIGVKKPANRFQRLIATANEVYQKALKVNADIYHFHDPELIRIGLKLLKHGKKVIYDVHEDVPRQVLSKPYLPGFSRHLIASRFERYENDAAGKFNHIITVTPFLEKRFKAINIKTTQVCNFPSLEEFPKNIPSWNQRRNQLCYVGGITEIRGIREMLKATEGTDIKLHLAGVVSPPELYDQITSLKGWSNVIEHGFLNRAEVQQLLFSSKAGLVLLHPVQNYQDAYPVKMFEYMAAGLPVIASGFPLWKSIVEGHQCGLCVNPLDTVAIADAISYLLSHEAEAEEMGMNGRKAIEEKYNWQQEEKKLIDIYEQVSNSKG